MPRPRLTREAIAFIVQVRNDPTVINTWGDIAQMVKDKFNIEVSLQAIAQSYQRHKDTVTALNHKVEFQKPTFNPENKKIGRNLSDPIFIRDENIDVKDLFNEAEQE